MPAERDSCDRGSCAVPKREYLDGEGTPVESSVIKNRPECSRFKRRNAELSADGCRGAPAMFSRKIFSKLGERGESARGGGRHSREEFMLRGGQTPGRTICEGNYRSGR